MNHLLCRDVPWNGVKTVKALKDSWHNRTLWPGSPPETRLWYIYVWCGCCAIPCVPNGVERPIAYASRTSTLAEKTYAQLEKEALSLIYGINMFHNSFMEDSFCYRSQTSIKNSRYKERITSTCCCTILEMGYHTYCVPIWPQIQIYQSTLKCRWIFKATTARTSHKLVESQQKWFRITEYEIV